MRNRYIYMFSLFALRAIGIYLYIIAIWFIIGAATVAIPHQYRYESPFQVSIGNAGI